MYTSVNFNLKSQLHVKCALKNYLIRNPVSIVFLIFSTVVPVFQLFNRNKGREGGCSCLFRIGIYFILYNFSFYSIFKTYNLHMLFK